MGFGQHSAPRMVFSVMAIELEPITDLSFVELTELFNRSFADYTVPVEMDVDGLA